MPPSKRAASSAPRGGGGSGAAAAGSEPPSKRARQSASAGIWRARCIREFGLADFPGLHGGATVNDHVKKASHATEEIWEAYYKQRSEHREYALALGKRADDDLDGEERLDDQIRADINKDLSKLLKRKGFPNRLSWEKHIHVLCPTESSWEDDDKPRSVDLLTYVYSPLALPRCIKLRLCFHQRGRAYSMEYYMGVYFNLLTPGGPREERQGSLAKLSGEEWLIDSGVPFVSSKGELLCGNSYEDPPDAGLGDKDIDLWTEVEAIDTSNYTPSTVRRIRSWLLASISSASAPSLIGDLELMKMLLAAAGAANSTIDLGYYWPQTHKESGAVKAQLIADGVWDEVGKKVEKVSWLDYQTRLATQSLNLTDSYYQPYDAIKAKAEWGRSVLEALQGDDDGTEDEEADQADQTDKVEMASLHRAPHIVWALAKEKALPWRRNREFLMDLLASRLGG